MNTIGHIIFSLLPHRLVGAVLLRQRFSAFARTNGLVYFGLLHADDDHEPLHGFTASTAQVDNYAIHGSVHGREVTILERTVTHTASPRGHAALHSHTWLIAAVKHDVPHAPHVLLLSHEHPRLHDEAVAIRHHHSEHMPIEYRLDGQFLIYARPNAAEDFKEQADDALVERFLARPGYDYEFDSEWLYVYSHSSQPTINELNQLLGTALTLVDTYEKSPV